MASAGTPGYSLWVSARAWLLLLVLGGAVAACRYQPIVLQGVDCDPSLDPSCPTEVPGSDGAGGADPSDPGSDGEPVPGDSEPGDPAPTPCACALGEICVAEVCNGAPTVAVPAGVIVEAGQTATLEAIVSDPDGDALTVTWTLASCLPAVGSTQTGSSFELDAALDSLPGECAATVSVSDEHQTVVRVVMVTVAAQLVGTYVHSGASCLNADYVDGLGSPQGTPAKPWCTLVQGLEAARALDAPVVYVSNVLQDSGSWLEVDAQDVEVIGGYEVTSGGWVHHGARTPVHIQYAADSGWKLWDYKPGEGPRPKITLRHFEVYRSSRCPAYCALISIEDVEATLDDVVLGEPGAAVPFERSSSATFVALSIEGKHSAQGTKATVQHSVIHGARAVDANADLLADNPTPTSYGIWAGPSAGASLELVLTDATVHGGEAAKLAAALHTTGVSQATLERTILDTQTAMLGGELGFGWLDGTNELLPTPDESCAGTEPCGGSSVVSISSSTITLDGYAVAVGLAAQGTDALSASAVDASVVGEVFAGGVWTVGAGASFASAVSIDRDSSFDVSALARRNYAAWPYTGAVGVLDGLFDEALGTIELVGSTGVEITGAAFSVHVLVPVSMPRIAAGALLVGTDSAILDGISLTVAGTRKAIGSASGVATVAGVWTLGTQSVLIRGAAIELASNLGVVRVSPLLDGAPLSGTAYVHGSSKLVWTANNITSIIDGTATPTERSCARAMNTRELAVESNVLACRLDASEGGVVPQLWLLDTQGATVLGNVLSGEVGQDAPSFTAVGLRDGKDGADEASPTWGSTLLAVERNVVHLTATVGRSAAVGMWLGAVSYAGPVANNAVVLMGADVAAGLRVTGPAQVALHHNTVRLGPTVANNPNGAAAAIHVVLPQGVFDRRVAIANNILELDDRQKAYHVLEQARVVASRLYVYAGNMLIRPSSPVHQPSPYAHSSGMIFPPSAATPVSLGPDLDVALEGNALEQPPNNVEVVASPFCAQPGAFHVVGPAGSLYTVASRVPPGDIDAEPRDGTPSTGADQFVWPGFCP